jgi:hypothetical protein
MDLVFTGVLNNFFYAGAAVVYLLRDAHSFPAKSTLCLLDLKKDSL